MTSAPALTNFSISGNTASYVQWDPVNPNPIRFPFKLIISSPFVFINHLEVDCERTFAKMLPAVFGATIPGKTWC